MYWDIPDFGQMLTFNTFTKLKCIVNILYQYNVKACHNDVDT